MIEQIILPNGEHPQRDDADFHFRIDAFRDGTADLLATNHGGGWVEEGPAEDLIRSVRRLAWELSDAGRRVVITYFLQHGAALPRSNHLTRVK
jgi:hypothetical protein